MEPGTLIETPADTIPEVTTPVAEAPATVAVVGFDVLKSRELSIHVRYDKIIPKRFHVDIELTKGRQGESFKPGWTRPKLVSKSFAVVADSFEQVFDVLPGLIKATTAGVKP